YILIYGYFVRSFSNSFKNFSFNTLINVPFIPSDLESMTPALSNFLSAFTMTERVIPTRSATFDATNNPSLPSNSSSICSITSSSLKANQLIDTCSTALLPFQFLLLFLPQFPYHLPLRHILLILNHRH